MKTRKLVRGVGLNDADYATQKNETIGYVDGKQKRKLVWICPFYQVWTNMINRCYSVKFQERWPTYVGCTVSDEWKTFSNFRSWMMTQDWQDKHLDKDILFEGNKVYSPETCVFVSGSVNNFTNDRDAARGEWLIGVYWHKRVNKFTSYCSNPFTKKQEYLGLFTSELEAHEAWLTRKLELAYELAAIQEDSRVAEALIKRYSNYPNKCLQNPKSVLQ